jgi:serine/threonine-protein kinase
MGAVYEATHETIHRRVAIKILHPQFAQSPELLTRFFNELRAA